MTVKRAFGSDAWMQAMERVVQRLLASADVSPDVVFAYCEVYDDPPFARSDDKRPGLIMRFCGNKATVQSGARGDAPADCTVHMDFAAAAASTKLKSGPELAAFGQKAYADGKMTMSGRPAGAPISMLALHDAMVDLAA